MVPFVQQQYLNGGYLFWPDEASSHCARAKLSFLERIEIKYVPKDMNPTIEDYFGILATHVYAKNWAAKVVEALKVKLELVSRKLLLKLYKTLHSLSERG